MSRTDRPSAATVRVVLEGEAGEQVPDRGGAYDYAGPVSWAYQPSPNGSPDPGEVVWAWASFADDPALGKDRPLALVGRTTDGRLVGLMLSSQDRTGDDHWLPIGIGPWDRLGRPSWVRCDRRFAVSPGAVRREAAVIPRHTFDAIVRCAGGVLPHGGARVSLLSRLMARLRQRVRRNSRS